MTQRSVNGWTMENIRLTLIQIESGMRLFLSLALALIGFLASQGTIQGQQLIDELYPILSNTEFIGGAQVGNAAPGESRMMLRYNSSTGHFLQLRISIFNYISQTSETMDATYTVASLSRAWSEPPPPPEPKPAEPYVDPIFALLDEAAEAGEIHFTQTINEKELPAYSRAYLTGSVRGFRGSANNGDVASNTESGPIQFDLDSARMKVEIAFQGSGLYWGSADIDSEQYMSLKALLFGNNYTAEMRISDEAWVAKFATEAQDE